MGRLVLTLFGLGAIAYVAFCLALWFGQTRLIFHPQPVPTMTPADVGLSYEDVWIEMNPGNLHGWWISAQDPDAKTVLILHGNASNVEDGLIHAQYFLESGLSALVVDYRGYGKSAGDFPNEASVYEDAAAAWTYLVQTRNMAPKSIVLFGHSIGGAIAVELASQQPQAGGAIIQASFTSMADMMDQVGYSRVAPKWLLTQHFDSESKVSSLNMPVLFIHGMNDRTIPALMSQQLYAIAPEPKAIWLVPGADHNDIAEVSGTQYRETLRQWLLSLQEKPVSAETVS
ncbi:alpha/beta hydrolase [Oscillatoria sp. CS-180]|uniref:alpha/beta hydrolase n=1 Tax=Oscillatoria sp. CS-180 TaxID=3021720 RepID=UPI00232BBAC4|nr:alpha/beta hydrolase [Oscillatoria sp. CS-180]MDB9525729.1 alpha/beta hydrolase [Oscillatoria sp. CS-180]